MEICPIPPAIIAVFPVAPAANKYRPDDKLAVDHCAVVTHGINTDSNKIIPESLGFMSYNVDLFVKVKT